MSERKYLPTFSDLVDRLSIVMLKSVFIPENRRAYREEMKLIEHDLDTLLQRKFVKVGQILNGLDIRAIMVVMLTNRWIWENESAARSGGTGDLDKLRATHSINGVRNAAKNVLARQMGERLDLKIDCLAADLPPEFGQWDLFEDLR